MGAANFRIKGSTCRRSAFVRSLEQDRATHVVPVTSVSELMPTVTPAFNDRLSATDDAFVSGRITEAKRYEDYINLIAEAAKCNATPLRDAVNTIKAIEHQIVNPPPQEERKHNNRVDLEHHINGILAQLNTCFQDQLIGWKHYLKRLGQAAGLDSATLDKALKKAVTAMDYEFGWRVNAEGDEYLQYNSAGESNIHVAFERDRPAISFYIDSLPIEIKKLYFSGLMGIGQDTNDYLEMLFESCFEEMPDKKDQEALTGAFKRPDFLNRLLSENAAAILASEEITDIQRQTHFAEYLRTALPRSKKTERVIQFLYASLTSGSLDGSCIIAKAYLDAQYSNLKPESLIKSLIESSTPELVFAGMVAKAFNKADQDLGSERQLAFDENYAYILSKQYFSVSCDSLIGSVLESPLDDVTRTIFSDADTTCGNMGDGERGTGLILPLDAQRIDRAQVNKEALIEVLPTFFCFLMCELYGEHC